MRSFVIWLHLTLETYWEKAYALESDKFEFESLTFINLIFLFYERINHNTLHIAMRIKNNVNKIYHKSLSYDK